jgi:hypothetical protein
MEKIPFDSSITAKIFHQAMKALHEYVGVQTREWGQLALTELNGTVDRVELSLKGKSVYQGDLTPIQEAEEKLLKAISSALLKEEKKDTPVVKEEVKEEPVAVKSEPKPKAPASKKKK